MQRALLTALASCASRNFRPQTTRFLAGLSFGELQFIAEFLGASILEADRPCGAPLTERVLQFRRTKCPCSETGEADQDHKLIVLMEYLRYSGLQFVPVPIRSR